MEKYYIYYRGKQVKEILCYNDNEALQKAKTWYNRYCADKDKHISNLAVKKPNGSMIR